MGGQSWAVVIAVLSIEAVLIWALNIQNRVLRARIEVLESCAKEMSGIYKELAKVINQNGQATEKILRHTFTAITDLTNIIIEQDTEEDDK